MPVLIAVAGRITRESAAELRAIAPLVIPGPSPQLIGPCTLVTNGARTIAFSSAELLRAAPDELAICTSFDGAHAIPVASWSLGRRAGIGIIELAAPFPADAPIAPIPIGAVCATIDTRGAPAALVAIVPAANGRGFARVVVPVHVDAIDGGGMSDDVLSYLVSPTDPLHLDAPIEGAGLFAWLPPDPVLGRSSEVVVVALAVTYRSRAFKPRDLPPIGELVGLEDLGRALPVVLAAEASNELDQVAGEIREVSDDPLAALDLDD